MSIDQPQNEEIIPPISGVQWYQKPWGIFIIVMVSLICVLSIAIFVLAGKYINNDNLPADDNIINQIDYTDLNNDVRLLAEKSNRPTFGNPDAKIVIVEFSDFRCPYCVSEFPIIREIASKYQDDILYIYRNFISQESLPPAHSAMCADEQGKFWQMHDRLFINADKTLSYADLQDLAVKSGVNLQQFNSCMENQTYLQGIIEDVEDGTNLGVSGTPTFFINGYKATGVISKEEWEEAIERLLSIIEDGENSL